jgi:dihydroorotate dehydrogenase (NAD+) catalytic subunit
MEVDLSTTIAGITMRNPVMLGSGPLGAKAKHLLAYSRVAGAVVTKSISIEPSKGNPHPRVIRTDHDGMINCEGGPNPGIKEFGETLRKIKPDMDCPLVGSLSPRTLRSGAGAEELATRFEEAGADVIELDLKYLYDEKEFRTDFSLKQINETLVSLKKRVKTPLIAKLAYGAIDVAILAKAAEDAGADAICAINSVFPAMKINIGKRVPALSMIYGGLSGAPIKPLAVAAVYRIAEAVKIPVIGVGGVMTGEDVIEFLLAGASAVQIYTVLMLEGMEGFSRLLRELQECMEKNGIHAVHEIVGAAREGGAGRKE